MLLPPREAAGLGRSARVLLVEDDSSIAGLFGTALERMGCEVEIAGSLASAWRLLEGPPPAVILLDLALPDGDGLDLIEPASRLPPVPPAILVVSARGGEEVARALALGARDFVRKPVHLYELRARVRAALRDRHTLERLDKTRERARRVAERNARLQQTTAALSREIDQRAVAAVLLREALDALAARAGSVGVLSEDRAEMIPLASAGFADSDVLPKRTRLRDDMPGHDAVRRGRPIFVGDPERARARYPAIANEATTLGEVAVGAVPLVANGRAMGAISLRFPPGAIPRSTRAFMKILGEIGGQALDRARLYERERAARARAEATNARLTLLAEIGALLAGSGGRPALLQGVADLVARRFADACLIDGVVAEREPAELLAVAGEPGLVERLRTMRRLYPLRADASDTARDAALEGRGVLLEDVDEARRRRVARDDGHLELLRAVGSVSTISVPIAARGRAFGVLTLLSTTPGRRFDRDDLAVAEEVARRCALEIERAQLHEAAQRELAERVAAEQALRESEERFRLLAEHAPDLVFRYEVRPIPRIAYVSPAVVQIVGLTPEEVYRDPRIAEQLLHPDDLVRGRLPVDDPAWTEPRLGLSRWRHRDGRYVWVETRSVPIRDAAGELVAVEGISRDVTQREQAQRELRLQARLLDSVDQAVGAVDFDGVMTYWNRRAEQLFGWPAADVVGRSAAELPLLERSGLDVAAMLELARRGEGWSGEVQLRRRDGSTFPALVAISPVEDERGQPVGALGVASDLTERRAAEADRLRLGQALALLEERERIAMELHDGTIQALYGAGLRLGALARTLPDGSPVGAALGEVIEQINGVIADVRRYVHALESPERPPGGLRSGLAAVVREHGSVRPRIELRIGADETSLERALGPAAVAHVLQVAREAISNAVRHAGAAIVVVSVRWSRRRFVLEVRDDGSGMPAAPPTREQHGLRNMAARAAVLGGHVDVSSRPGQGTTVRLEVPLASAVGGAR